MKWRENRYSSTEIGEVTREVCTGIGLGTSFARARRLSFGARAFAAGFALGSGRTRWALSIGSPRAYTTLGVVRRLGLRVPQAALGGHPCRARANTLQALLTYRIRWTHRTSKIVARLGFARGLPDRIHDLGIR